MNEDLQVIEPQRGTKKKQIKRIPTGNGKRVLKLVSTIILTFVFLGAITWIVALFLPDNVQKAFDILRNLY